MTLDDVKVKDKTALVRVDINSPIDPETGEILDDNRIRMCSNTLKELSEKEAKTAVIAHQGRPDSEDFTTLEKHAEKMSQVLDIQVDYIDDIFGSDAQKAISNLETGEILLLENVRFYPGELKNKPADEQAKTELVRKLSPLADIYVNDAFAAAHRSQPSLVGFAVALPAVAGRLMERELRELGRARDPEHPCVYVLGGAKVDDSLSLTNHVLEKEIADYVLTGGLVGNLLLAAGDHDLGESNIQVISEKGYENEIKRGRKILSTHGEKVKVPQDVRVEKEEGEAELISVSQLPTEMPIYDIGDKTISKYSELIQNSKTVVTNGPVGVFEKPAFAKGTNEILKAMSKSNAFTVIGGGHMVAAARELGVEDKLDHVSTGGGSCLSFLSGEKLPVVQALEQSAEQEK
ncbi:phosphoglycerate kinase [candidate division MSBL1 archaeon SCGC-AAA261F17]|uniref:Phosphoglycerate kinase n=1 Tax=candidate division MSBL1 archaeon SCGC-AAA261F17 TaxID=1698274 RepID=A0A133V7M0_9EURY|nr:phosphoglycerate kinase [candidate division MSBL1 archaeon SCGC-AAA261F17]